MATGYCFGCARTRDEIAGWMNYTDGERQTIMNQLKTRMKDIERKPRRITRRQRLALERGETLDAFNRQVTSKDK